MIDENFRLWIINKIHFDCTFHLRDIKTRLSNVENTFNIDLNKEYKKDMGKSLLSWFNYSLEDEKDNRPTSEQIANLIDKSSILNEVNSYKGSLRLYFDYLRDLDSKTPSYNFDKLTEKQTDSLKRISDSIINYLHKCESLPLNISSNSNNYYGVFLDKKSVLLDNGYGNENDCANLAAAQTIIDAETERYTVALVFEQEGFFLRNIPLYKDLYEFISYDMQYIIRDTDFYDPNEDYDLEAEELSVQSEVSDTPPQSDIAFIAATSLVCEKTYTPSKNAEELYARIEFKGARRAVATERLHYLLSSFLQ